MKWLLSLLAILALLLGATELVRYRMVQDVAFLNDRVYVDMAIASHLNTDSTYGPEPGAAIPAVRDTLWRSLLAIGGGNGAVDARVPLSLAFLSAALLLVLVMLWHSGIPGPDWRRGLAGLLLICTSPLVSQALGGTSDLLAACLVLGATMLHVRGFAARQSPLSAGSAVLLGLAAWLRIECAFWWLLFSLHALMVATRGLEGNRRPLGWVWLRAANGALLIAILVAPLIAWNMRVIGVPWPQAPDALAIGAAGSGVVGGWLAEVPRQWLRGYVLLHQSGPLQFIPATAVFLCGLASSVTRVLRKEADGGLLLPAIAYVVLPPLYALASPWVGREGGTLLFASASPLWLPALIEGCWYLGRTLVLQLRKAGMREDSWVNPTRAAGILAGVLALWGLRYAGGTLRVENFRLRDLEQGRILVRKELDHMAPKPRRVATDRPGWALCIGLRVADIGAQVTPALLSQIEADGSIPTARLIDFLHARGTDALLLWERSPAELGDPATAISLRGPGVENVYLGRFTRRAAP